LEIIAVVFPQLAPVSKNDEESISLIFKFRYNNLDLKMPGIKQSTGFYQVSF